MSGEATAGGELPAIGGRTRLVAIVGHPVQGSLSPAMHNAAFAALGLDWRYLAFDVEPQHLERALAGARAMGCVGLNVTAPHKAAAARLVNRRHGIAEAIGSVNTIVFGPDGASGHSTDGAGFLAAIAERGQENVAGKRAVVLGAGGAGLSVAAALVGAGARVTLANRDAARLAGAMATLDRAGYPVAGRPLAALADELRTVELLVNSIPPSTPSPPVPVAELSPTAAVFDLTYRPAVPPLVAALHERGHRRAWNGLGMLVHQGARSLALWCGREPPLGIMAAAVGYRR